MRSNRIVRGASLVIGAVVAAGCATPPPADTPARPVVVEKVETGRNPDALRYAAGIQPREQVALSFTVSGYVQEILRLPGSDGAPRDVQQGDVVRRGTVLARLRENDYRERVNQAKAQTDEAAASLEKARLDRERADRLYATQSLTRPELDAARAAFEGARARAAAGSAQLEAAEIVLRDAALVAPRDAVVLQRNVERGTLAAPGSAAFVLADVSSVKAVFGVPDRIVGTLANGRFLTVTTDDAVFQGRVTAISPSADGQSRVFNVEVTIDNRAGTLKPGMIASVVIPDTARRDDDAGPGIPVRAIVKTDDGAYAVFVVEGSGASAKARLRRVHLGAISGERVVATAGLAPGEPVIVSGATLLVDGEAVNVIP